MINKYSLGLLVFLCALFSSFGQQQIYILDFETNGGYTTSVPEFTDNDEDYFIRTDGTSNIDATQVQLSNQQDLFYFGVNDTDADGGPSNLSLNISNIDITGYSNLELRIYIAEDDDGSNQDWDGDSYMHINGSIDSATSQNILWIEAAGGTNTEPRIDTNFNGSGNGASITDMFTQFSNSFAGTGNSLDLEIEFNNINQNDVDIAIDNIEIWGIPSCTDAVDFANIQFPNTAQTITVGDNLNVFAQCYELGLTDIPFSQGAGIDAWIGYSSINNNPNSTGWTWIPAAYNDTGGNNDEYQANLGTAITVPGTYYYASRFELNGCGYVYGGSGGIWNNDSVQLTVDADQVDFCNVDFPKTATITTGDNHLVYAQAFEPGVTDSAGQGANLLAWIGYNTIDNDPSSGAGWTWIAATYDSDFGNNDQYVAEIGSVLPAGTYYYASRFQLNGSAFSYGGIQSDNVGNFWDPTTNNSGILIINNPPVADVVITEIMYNTPNSFDYEWIEICNLNGTDQDVSNYTIDVNGSTVFTFPSNATVPANDCITVLLGHLVNSPAPECPFTPDFSNPIGNTDFLFNGGATITIETSFGPTVDSVAYDDADSNATDGNGSSFHVIDATMDNSDTNTNWQAVLTGGSPGDNTVVSPCAFPEIQLQDDSGTDQVCGAFTIDFGSQATGFDTDITFDIDNDGALDLNISSLALSGVNSGDFSIVSPATPFTVTPANTQTVTVRFTPAALGNRTADLTINSNDSDESSCVINLQGNGVTPAPEINVEGDIGTFPDINNGDTTPAGFDNTLFAAQFIGNSQEKTFRIQNIGTDVLNISSVTVVGANPGDFTVTIAPASSVAISSVTVFEVSFSPLAAGTRTADISIANDDADENPYTFRVQGDGNCVANALTISPVSGPIGTIVTLNGSDLTTATASVNGIPSTVTNISATTMEVTIPAGATTGNIEIIDDLGCPGTVAFTVIDNQIGTCEGGSALSELFISEVTDATYGSLSYIEIYNATGSAINLANYEVRVYANGSDGTEIPDASTNPAPTVQTLSGIINAGDTFVLTTGTFGVLGNALCSTPGGDGSYGDQTSNILAGVNVANNGHDFIGLYNSSNLIDSFGVFGSENWMNTTSITGDRGFNFRRLNTAANLPTTSYNNNDWNIIDWTGSGSTTCVNTNDYSDIGMYDFSTGTPPTVSLQPIPPTSTCDLTASLAVSGTEGFAGGNSLAYQWFFSVPGDTTWTAVTNNATYSGATTATLDISNTLNLNGYQYYCQVREDDASCYTASNAVRLDIQSTTWSAGDWTNSTPPDGNTIAIIDDDYNTNLNGDITACNLIVNANNTLTVTDGNFVLVENNVSNSGTIAIQTRGSFVQNGVGSAAGSFTNIGAGSSSVTKSTSTFDSTTGSIFYTYWSSPVINAGNLETVFPNANGNRRYSYNASNFIDSEIETANNNGTTPGQDDIDDNGNDWEFANGNPMEVGRGYAVTAAFPPPMPGNFSDISTFNGALNTGDITVPIYKNNNEVNDNNWNFIGNPYPSAVSAQAFLIANATLDNDPTNLGGMGGALFFWSQVSNPDANNNGNENVNFSQSDYAIINGVSGIAGGATTSPPSPYIPSGQGFFVSFEEITPTPTPSNTVSTVDVIFTNAMRETGNNTQFFEANNTLNEDDSASNNSSDKNTFWLNLTSDNGAFSQVSVAYVNEASNGFDGWYFDTPRNFSTEPFAAIYTLISDEEKKFAIQGRNLQTLSNEEIIPVGFYSKIDMATIYSFSLDNFEGSFMVDNPIYIKDNLTTTIHNLKESDYDFTSDTGEFNNRFEIVFNMDTLSLGDNELDNNSLTIIEHNDGQVEFKISDKHQINNIEILDILGRTVYSFEVKNGDVTIYNFNALSQSAYIARVTLEDGQTITQKSIKKQ